MHKYFSTEILYRYLMKNFLFVLLMLNPVVLSQTKTNLEVFYSLNDSLVKNIVSQIPENRKTVLLNLNLGEKYSLFSNRIKDGFIKRGFKVLEQPPDELNIPEVNIVYENAGVEYGEMERDGWFGDYITLRKIFIRGNYLQSFSENGMNEFIIASVDTIKVDDIDKLENSSFPFTHGEVPAEPFLSSLIEPVIAIGVAAAAVILFFSVRSK